MNDENKTDLDWVARNDEALRAHGREIAKNGLAGAEFNWIESHCESFEQMASIRNCGRSTPL